MTIQTLKSYQPNPQLTPCIDGYWSSRNLTGESIHFPVVPDGCSDIIFYLNNSKKLHNQPDTFVTGIMEYTQLIPVAHRTELFGVRFKPGMLYYLLKTDMGKLTNERVPLDRLNTAVAKELRIDPFEKDRAIVSFLDCRLGELFQSIDLHDSFIKIVEQLSNDPQTSITVCAEQFSISLKTLQRLFCQRLGLTPKKFERIMRFHKAHRKISKTGLKRLVMIALTSGYYDQAHFNREYKKLAGCNPTSETMSILYNT